MQAFKDYTGMRAALKEVAVVPTSPAEQQRRSRARGHSFVIDFASEQKEAAFTKIFEKFVVIMLAFCNTNYVALQQQVVRRHRLQIHCEEIPTPKSIQGHISSNQTVMNALI